MENAMQRLNNLIKEKNSRICAGLDPTWENIPDIVKKESGELTECFILSERFSDEEIEGLSEEEKEKIIEESEINIEEMIFLDYCMQYIEAVQDVVPAIKINSAFFEECGLEDCYFEVAQVAKNAGLFVIGDVKRADIGNTSEAYAEAYLGEDSPFDAITINPYFGTDGVMPFLKLAKEHGKGVFVLVKTSNKSSAEIQDLELKDGRKVYEAVSDLVVHWGKEVDAECYGEDGRPRYPMIGAVIGATHPEQAENLLWRMGNIFALVPGYGAQGATADDIAICFNKEGLGAIVNSSRGIMNAYKNDRWKDEYSEETWAEAARAEAIRATDEINEAIARLYYEDICVKL